MKFTCECEIKEDIVNRLRNEASHDFMGHKNIEDVVPRIFYVNNAPTRKPEGIFCTDFRGDFRDDSMRPRDTPTSSASSTATSPPTTYYIIRPTAASNSSSLLTSELGAAVVDFSRRRKPQP